MQVSVFIFFISKSLLGNGNPLQCSCLENPRDGGSWWAAVCGVAQSRTRLKRLSSSRSSKSLLELGAEGPQLLGHLPRRPQGPACPGEGASAAGATGRAVVSGTELPRAGSRGARHLPGAPTELRRDGGVKRGPRGSATTTPIPHLGSQQTSLWQPGPQKLVGVVAAEQPMQGLRVRMGGVAVQATQPPWERRGSRWCVTSRARGPEGESRALQQASPG